jgi:hypothetical protein
MVEEDLNKGWTSRRVAEEVHGLVVKQNGEKDFTVDIAAGWCAGWWMQPVTIVATITALVEAGYAPITCALHLCFWWRCGGVNRANAHSPWLWLVVQE